MAKRFDKLAKMFDTALNDSFADQSIPSFDKIIVFLEKNKKKSRFYDEMLKFYFYLQTFNVESEGDNRQVNPSLFFISAKSVKKYRQLLEKIELFLFSNTAVLEAWKRLEMTNLSCYEHGNFTLLDAQKEAYRRSLNLNKQQALRLFESTEIHISHRDSFEQKGFFTAFREASNHVNAEKIKTIIIDPVMQTVKNTVANVKLVSENVVKQGWNTIWESVNNPATVLKNIGNIFNAKTIPVGLLFAAGYPTAAMSLAQKDIKNNQVNIRKKRRIIRSPYLERIINGSSYEDWPRYNSYLNEIIKELEDELVASRNRLSYPIKSKIFWFLRNFDKPFTQEQSKKINQIVQKVLAQKDSELFALKENDLSILEDILILAKVTFPNSDKDFTIFNLYIDAAKNNKLLIYTKKAANFITQLFDICEMYLPASINSTAELFDLIRPIQSLIDRHLVWNKNDPVAMLVRALSFLKKIKKKYKVDTEVTKFIDEYAKEIIEKAIKLIPAKFFDYPEFLIKEDIGAAYVKALETSARNLFKGMYEIRTPKDSLPYSESRGVRGAGRSPNFNIEISYDQLSDAKKVEAFQLAREAYLELVKLMTLLNLSSVRKGPINIQIKLFNDNKHFERDGYMVFDVDSSGGGVCIPGEGDTVGIAFIYQTEQGFLNFKHEIIHALMMYFFGRNYSAFVSGAFVEGIADFIDKGSVNSNKMNVLRWMFEKNEIKPLSEIVTLNEGGSIVYTWGYFWLKYMIEEGAQEKIATIFSAIQKQDKAEVTRLIDEYGRVEANHFKRWIVKLNQDYTPTVPTRSVHDDYMQDLQKSQELLQFIKRNSGLKFIFKNDMVFLMEEGKLFIYRGRTSRKETADSSDYHWLMEALAIDVIKTKLKQLGQREKTICQGIISSMLSREEVDSYLLVTDIQNGNSISLRADSEAASALEDFILRTNKKLHWALNRAYPRVRRVDHSSFEKIMKLEIEEREAKKFAEENGFNLDNPATKQPYKPDYSNKNTNSVSAEKRWPSKKIELSREVIDLKNALVARDTSRTADLISKIDFKKFYINTQFSENKNTLLHLAILANDLHVVWVLVYKGACLTTKNAQGKVPYDLVTSKNKDNIADFIDNALQCRERDNKSNISPEKKTTTKNSFDRSTQLPPLFPTKPIEFIPSATNPPQIEEEPRSALPMIIGGGLALTAVLGLGGLGYYFSRYFSRKRNKHRKMIAKSIVERDFPRYPQNTAQAEKLLGIYVDGNSRDNHLPMQSFSVGSLSENFERGRLEAFNEEFLPLFPKSSVDSVSSEEGTYFLPHPPEELLSQQRTSYSSDSIYNNGDSGRGSSLASSEIGSNLERGMFLFRLATINASLEVLQNKLQAFPENIRNSVAFSRMFTDPLTTISYKLDEAMSAHYDPLIFRTSLESFIAEDDENKGNSLKTMERYLSSLESKKSKEKYKVLFNDFRTELIIQINYLNCLAKKWSEVLSPGFIVTAEDEIAKADSRILLTRKTMSLVRGYFFQLERLTSEVMESELNVNKVCIALQALKSIFFHADLENITDKPFPKESSQFIAQCVLCSANFDLAAKQLLTLGQEILNIDNKELRGNFSKTHQLFEKLCQQNNYFFTNRIDFTKGKQEGLKDGISVALKFSAQTAHRLEETTSKSKVFATNPTASFRNRHAFHRVNGGNLAPVYENNPSNSFR